MACVNRHEPIGRGRRQEGVAAPEAEEPHRVSIELSASAAHGELPGRRRLRCRRGRLSAQPQARCRRGEKRT